VNYSDPAGHAYQGIYSLINYNEHDHTYGGLRENFFTLPEETSVNVANEDESVVLKSKSLSFYKGIPVIRMPFGGNVGFSAGVIFLGPGVTDNGAGIATLKHEYGHVVHLSEIGWESYTVWVLIPSIVNYHRGVGYDEYYSQVWEYIADVLGGVERMNGQQPYAYAPGTQERAIEYYQFTREYVGVYPIQ
jgi:hypothetical protein